MTTPAEHADLGGAVERLTRASNTFPIHINREGIGTIRVRQGDVFAVLGQVEAQAALLGEMAGVLAEAERFMAYFAEGTRTFVGPGTPKESLAQVRAVLAKVTAR